MEKQEYYYISSDGKAILSSYDEYGYDEHGNQIGQVFYSVDYAGNAKPYTLTERAYVKRGNWWDTSKNMNYSFKDGEKYPNWGSEYVYDEEGYQTKYIGYEADGKEWKINEYTVFHKINLGNSGVKDATKNVEASRTYDGNNKCIKYTVECYVFQPYE